MSNELVSSKYTFACDPEHCDCLIELTSSDGFGFPSGVVEITCPCGRKPTLLSVQHATIQPTNERNNMETTTEVPTTYNANVLVTYKDIIDGVATYPTVKVNDLEYKLERIKNLEDFLSRSQGTIRQIIDKLTVQEWYNPNTDKDEVLRELCEILDHEPKQEIRITGTITFDIRYDCPLDEVEDFDARYFAQDNLTLDSYHGDVIVESFDVEDADVDW
jgi:hypothetical protein